MARKTLAVTVLLGLASRLYGQTDDGGKFTGKLLQNRYGLSVRDGRLAGTGAPVLQSAIAQSRFILPGEIHGLAETPKFGAGVCSVAGPQGFHTMAVEEGQLAAAELERWVQQAHGSLELPAIEKQYPGTINIYG